MKTIVSLILLTFTFLSTSTAHADIFGSGSNAFGIDFVTIGNPGNDADSEDGDNILPGTQNFGAIAYEYRMGQFEISEDMIDKANAQSLLDGNSLGLTKDTRGANKPATSISWFEAAQFVNWLNTSSGGVPAYKFDGFGSFQLWTQGDAGYDSNNLYRNSQAKYFLPSADEWYKAAYYDPNSGGYYKYPTGSDTIPTSVASGSAAGTAVYGNSFEIGPADVSLTGGMSPFGTLGQGGNVWEWEETDYDLVNDSSSALRGSRGGNWYFGSLQLRAVDRGSGNAEYPTNGFRVASASVPEPSSLIVIGLGALGFAGRRSRRSSR